MKKIINLSLVLIYFGINLFQFGWYYLKSRPTFFIILGLTLMILFGSSRSFYRSNLIHLSQSQKNNSIILTRKQKNKLIKQLNWLLPQSKAAINLENRLIYLSIN